VVGLAIGLAATLLIVLYVTHEYSFDRFHERGNRIVKVELKHEDGDNSYEIPWMSYQFGEAVKQACPEVEDFARFKEDNYGSKLVQSDANHTFFESRFGFADQGFVRIFSFQFLQGDPTTALSRPNTVVVTQSIARKYFGNAEPLGKTILYDKKHVLEVVGVVKDPAPNSSMQFDFLADIGTSRAVEREMYRNFMSEEEANKLLNVVEASGSYHTYFLLHPDASADK
jgi:putative ABC transport system permease protein